MRPWRLRGAVLTPGFQYRDMGRMTSDLTETDDVETVRSTGKTVWLDYSGFYVKVGVGYDLVR